MFDLFDSPKALLVLLLPILFMVFYVIYRASLTLLVFMVSLAVGGFGKSLASVIPNILVAVSLFFAIGTCVWVWKQARR